jgi:hypothetical protein
MKVFRLLGFLVFLVALTACATITPFRPTAVALTVLPTEAALPQTAKPAGEAGLALQGKVTLDGRPLEGVKIYRSFASYQGEVVAITSKDGTYRSEFVAIPGDEMVTVWAELRGYTFAPEKEYWRHYYGYEERTLDFTASKP